jgi:hypothetical protein
MAEYKGIKGFKVQYLSADPSDPIIGQTWYNSTSKDLKYTGATAAASWATGANVMGTARRMVLAGCWHSNSSFSFWWRSSSRSSLQDATEEYDGTTWTASSNRFKYSKRRFRRLQVLKQQHLAFGGYVGNRNSMYRSNRRI